MDALPRELVWHISTYLPRLSDLSSLLFVSSFYASLLDDDNFWRNVAQIYAPRMRWSRTLLSSDFEKLHSWKLAVRAATRRARIPVQIRNVRDRRINESPHRQGSGFESYDALLKLVIVGPLGVGKSCLMFRHFDRLGYCSPVPTIGVEFRSKIVRCRVPGFETVKVQCWDTAGQERFMMLCRSYYRGAAAVILCFDLTNVESFKAAQTRWLDQIVNHSENAQGPWDLNLFLAGTKLDLVDERVVSREEAEEFAKEHGFLYFETSAMTCEGLSELFGAVVDHTMEKYVTLLKNGWGPTPGAADREATTITSSSSKTTTSSWCWW